MAFLVDDVVGAIVLGSIISAGTAAASTAFNAYSASEADRASYGMSKDLARYQALEIPSLQMKGYEKAGINPMLAYSNLGGSMPTLTSHAAQASTAGLSDIGRLISNMPGASSAKDAQDAQARLANANAEAVPEQTKINAAESASRIAKNQADEERIRAETAKILFKGTHGEFYKQFEEARKKLLEAQEKAAGRDMGFNFGGFHFNWNSGDMFSDGATGGRTGAPVNSASAAKTNSEAMFDAYGDSIQSKKDLERFRSDPNFGERFLKRDEYINWRAYVSSHRDKPVGELWRTWLNMQEFYNTRSGAPNFRSRVLVPYMNDGRFYMDHGMQ